MPTLTEFLSAFYPDPNESISLRAFGPRNAIQRHDNGTVLLTTNLNQLSDDTAFQEHLKNLNQNRGIYFVVNSGGDNDASITRFNAFFVECDNLPIHEQHRRLDSAPLQPSIRVETKKSVHATT